MRYRFIQDQTSQFRIAVMCRVLKVSTSGFYAWLVRGESERSIMERALVEQIMEVHRRSDSTYG